jgi:hypothetical protein
MTRAIPMAAGDTVVTKIAGIGSVTTILSSE